MKHLLFVTVATVLVFTAGSAAWYISKLHAKNKPVAVATPAPAIDNTVKEKLNTIAASAKQYAVTNKYNTQFCFLIDMSIASGKRRFFVYDLKKNKVTATGLVTHGCCNQRWLAGRKYDNAVGCGCTSLGKYKVGNPYKGRFGLAYKLYGLEATNSNAYNRFVVLHAMQCVPEKEVEPYPICQSDGCPSISPGFLQQLSPLIDASKQPVLLWIFE